MSELNENEELKSAIEDLNNIQDNGTINLKKQQFDENYYALVEKERSVLSLNQKRVAKRATISIAIIALCCVAGLTTAVISEKNPELPWIQYLIWVFVGIAVISLVVFSVMNKRIDKPDYKGYITKAYTYINTEVFKDTQYDSATFDPLEKVNLSEISSDRVYKTIEGMETRAVINGSFKTRTFKACECGIYKGVKGRQRLTNFVGKLVLYKNNLHFEDRFLYISKSSGEQVDIPDDIDDLELLFADENKYLYGPKGSKYKDALGTKVIPALNKIKVDNHLMNLTVCFWAGKTTVYLSYDNNVVMLPFTEPYDNSGAEQYKRDLLMIFEALESTVGE